MHCVGPGALQGWNGAPTTGIPVPSVPILCRWIPMGSLSHRQKFLVRPQQISGTPTTEGGVGITVVGVPEISGTVVGVPENNAGRFLLCLSLSVVSALASETSDVPLCNASVRHVYTSQSTTYQPTLFTPLFLVCVLHRCRVLFPQFPCHLAPIRRLLFGQQVTSCPACVVRDSHACMQADCQTR